MTGPLRSGCLAPVGLGLAGLLACAPSAPDLLACAAPEECPPAVRCVSGACVANAPPSAAVTVPPSPQTNVLLAFDASGSADPDDGDSIVSFVWTFRRISAEPCEVPAVAGTGPTATVRFACPGRWAVDVAATDELGASSTATAELDVAAYGGPALVTVGPDVAVDHVCTAQPRCTPSGPVALSAAAPGSETVSFLWSVEPPPDRPLETFRRVTFSPGPTDPAPTVAIETDGQAIGGDWVFRVEARDPAGVIGVASVRVSVLNRPPEIVASVPVPDHAFGGSHFTAAGQIPFTASDPDGDDLLEPEVAWHHVGDGASTFSGSVLDGPPRVTFAIAVPYAVPADAAHLRGGPGLERTIVFSVSDVNGARTEARWPVVVGNRPPVLVDVPAPFSIDHGFDPVGGAYVADVPLSTWRDPDGDPLFQVPGSGTGDPDCAEILVQGDLAVARCRLPFAGVPAVGNFAGAHTVTQAIQDPWSPADATSTVTFTILNRPPSITTTATHVVSDLCVESSACCLGPPSECIRYSAVALAGTSTVTGRWWDPDGDPLDVQVAAAGSITPEQPLVCVPDACALRLHLAEVAVCGTFTTTLPTTVTDGVASASGSLPVRRGCP